MRTRTTLLLAAVASIVAAVVTAPAHAGVRIVDRIDLEEAATQGAIGLAVPGAGAAVTRAGALRTLVTGVPTSSFVDTADTPPKLVLGGAEPPDLQVTLPPEGKSRNDRRYPIALTGTPGTVLTSDSTRITGLVSLGDIANDRLRTVAVDDPVATLERLDRRIDRNSAIRMPLTLALVFASIAAALAVQRFAPRLILLALAANLWLVGWWLVALLALAALLFPLGVACAALLGVYLATLGLDPESVALSPFGPSQAGRFYGLSNLLSTWLLLPALLGVAAIRNRKPAVALAVVAVVAVGGNRFGADGGGLLVLLVGYGVLALRQTGNRLTLRRAALLAGGAAAAGAALVALDAMLGGSSHVTSALGDGPGALLDDIGRRLEASFNRATGSVGAATATLIGLGGLVFMATRRGRGPATDAILAAVIVSLLVNDTPTDVASVGATIAFVAHRFERGSHVAPPVGLDRLRAMRRPTIVAASLLAGLLLAVAGCGGDEVTATPETVIGDLPTETSGTTEDLPALALEGDAANGETVFAAQGCGACHTLAAAGASGTIGPSLDEAKPSYELAVERVTLGLGGMPSFGDKLEAQEIADVAEYVSSSAGS